MRRLFWTVSAVVALILAFGSYEWHKMVLSFAVLTPFWIIAAIDSLQTKHSLQRNFPLFAHLRYLMETIRPGIQQYFVENNREGRPFDRERRSLVYRRAKKAVDTLPFGTESRCYETGYEWINHAMKPAAALHDFPRIVIGHSTCEQPYAASLMNVSAMSYGSLSQPAVLALNKGAKMGGFYHNSGEGGVSPYHLEHGGDLVWQLGTAYFGARTKQGAFHPEKFAERAAHPHIKMIELKLSQGAKPGHGGILPASKLTAEIAAIRDVEMGSDVLSPPGHTAFETPLQLIDFLQQLRRLSGGKPVGFKLCVGRPEDFFAIAKAMLERNACPDFITVDGAEGGTGAAPLEFSNSVGTPLKEGLTLVHNTLVGIGMRERIKVIAAGKIVSGFDVARHMALGADLVNCARAMMFALGCIQAQRCNTNDCPTGVATQDPRLSSGLVVSDKSVRVANFQRETLRTLMEVVAAGGLSHPSQLGPQHIMRRVSAQKVCSFAELYPESDTGAFLRDEIPEPWRGAWRRATAESFQLSTPRRGRATLSLAAPLG